MLPLSELFFIQNFYFIIHTPENSHRPPRPGHLSSRKQFIIVPISSLFERTRDRYLRTTRSGQSIIDHLQDFCLMISSIGGVGIRVGESTEDCLVHGRENLFWHWCQPWPFCGECLVEVPRVQGVLDGWLERRLQGSSFQFVPCDCLQMWNSSKLFFRSSERF